MAQRDRMMMILKEGGIVWIPCEVKEGMFPTERYIRVEIPERKAMIIAGFVPGEDVCESKGGQGHAGEVRAVIARLVKDTAALLFRGEILSTTNPVVVPSKWVLTASRSAAR
jgi:hypothetical protein